MKTLPNGITVFNATPHAITFWREDWNDVVSVDPDERIDAKPEEKIVKDVRIDVVCDARGTGECQMCGGSGCLDFVSLVRTEFIGTDEGLAIIASAKAAGADLIVGSIIAAQAYPGDVVAMVPVSGFERVPPTEKRMRPDKFTTF